MTILGRFICIRGGTHIYRLRPTLLKRNDEGYDARMDGMLSLDFLHHGDGSFNFWERAAVLKTIQYWANLGASCLPSLSFTSLISSLYSYHTLVSPSHLVFRHRIHWFWRCGSRLYETLCSCSFF